MKRMISILAVFCLLLTMAPITALAETMTRMSASQVMTLQPNQVDKGTIAPQVNPPYADALDPQDAASRPQTVTVPGPGCSDTVAAQAVPALDLPACLDSEWEVLRLTNRKRHKAGLDPVTTQDILFKAAGIRAEEITEQFDHIRPDNSNFTTVFFDVEYPWYSAGENISAGRRTPSEVVTAWMNSHDHRENILCEEFTHLGVGYASSDDVYAHYWTQLFTTGWECRYSDLELCVDYLEVEQGTELETVPLWAEINCGYCGVCYLPVLPEYCQGYESGTPGTYTVTVTVYGLSDTLQVSVLGEEPEPVTAYGDANGDGRINTKDLLVLRKYLNGAADEVDSTGADLNGDSKVNTRDLLMLRKYLNGEDIPLGPQN